MLDKSSSVSDTPSLRLSLLQLMHVKGMLPQEVIAQCREFEKYILEPVGKPRGTRGGTSQESP